MGKQFQSMEKSDEGREEANVEYVLSLIDIDSKMAVKNKNFTKDWIKFLVGNESEEDIALIISLYEEGFSWGSIIMEFRKILRASGRRGSVEDQLIVEAFLTGRSEDLKCLFSEKCLEALTLSDIRNLYHCIEKGKNKSITTILNKLNRNPQIRLMRAVL